MPEGARLVVVVGEGGMGFRDGWFCIITFYKDVGRSATV